MEAAGLLKRRLRGGQHALVLPAQADDHHDAHSGTYEDLAGSGDDDDGGSDSGKQPEPKG